METFDIKKDLIFWDKIKVEHFEWWETRYFICYFKWWILNTDYDSLWEDDFWTTISSCILSSAFWDRSHLFYNTKYKEFNSLKWELVEVEVNWIKYKVEIKDRLSNN